MKRIIVICEGHTEKEFCQIVLSKYFINLDIIIEAPLIKKSNGGIVKWMHLKKQIEVHLKEDPSAIITTLIDYYGTNEKHSFPRWGDGLVIPNKLDRMEFFETAMKADIDATSNYRFIPYIQLHEFEGLLFNDLKIFQEQIPPEELLDLAELKRVIDLHPNPELINDSKETAPSVRLGNLINGYSKRIYGPILAEAIGLSNIRAKSLRFNNWISELETI